MKKNFLLIMLGLVLLFSPKINADCPEPYCSIVDLPFDNHGWFVNKDQLEICLKEKPINTIIEIGSWLGCSTRFFASSIGENGKVYAVDTWKGSVQEVGGHKDPRLPYLYQLFLSNVKHAKLTNKIIPVRMESAEAAKALNVQADLIYIDAAHDAASVYQDIMVWSPHLKKDGILCGDDWQWATVQEGVTQAARELNKSIYSSKNFWRLY
ncbi:MAG: class I SAM-dependent methyltransferase [Parachlamydia sp.]|jgi:predicted O-methyltransferase YrrM|nr:class I SAM-dependent methyltransferase [Parachlamydia sp.]